MKNNIKIIIGIFIGILTSTITVVLANTIISSKEISYDNSKSKGSFKNVQDSLDELYQKAGYQGQIWKDPILNGADPILTDKLIPITIDNDGTVHYANLYTKWYDYSDKKWANAVILVDNPKNGGSDNYVYKTGDIIKEEDIESYFIWIPRYKYKIWDLGKYTSVINVTTLSNTDYASSVSKITGKSKLIDIIFEGKDKEKSGWKNGIVDEASLEVSFNQNNAYLTHPAFTLADTELNGIWVGKFELGYNQLGDGTNPITDIDDTSKWTGNGASVKSDDSKKIIIKPNINSWRNNTIRNFFFACYNYARELNSHMIKNTEWGAIAYLSHSAYGIGSEIRVNNTTLSGYSAAAETNQGVFRTLDEGINKAKPYNTSIGYLASTTGNITGIYDMAGGLHDYVAANIDNNVGSSELTLEEINKYANYFDKYSSSNLLYSGRILGDATGELGAFYSYIENDGAIIHNSWYGDVSNYFSSAAPWLSRGGCWNYGIAAGQFSFTSSNGAKSASQGTRLVIAV